MKKRSRKIKTLKTFIKTLSLVEPLAMPNAVGAE